MLYQEYEKLKVKYTNSQKVYDDLLTKKEDSLKKGQISQTDKLKEAKLIMQERAYLLRLKREELNLSKEKYDRVYYLRFIKKCKINQISRLTNYSIRQVNRILKEIKDRL